MHDKAEKFALGVILGSFLTYLIVSVTLTNMYGKLSNHVSCDQTVMAMELDNKTH